jgi:hypothetical protein
VLLTLNLNDTILQKENAFIFQQITCGKAALCYTQPTELVQFVVRAFLPVLALERLFHSFQPLH